jgi:hypothetical protein
MEVKKSTTVRVPVRLLDVTGAAVTGVVFGAVTAALRKANDVWVDKAVLVTDWFLDDAVRGPGDYDLLLGVGDTDTIGFLRYSVASAGCTTFIGIVEIVANIESDTYNFMTTKVLTTGKFIALK